MDQGPSKNCAWFSGKTWCAGLITYVPCVARQGTMKAGTLWQQYQHAPVRPHTPLHQWWPGNKMLRQAKVKGKHPHQACNPMEKGKRNCKWITTHQSNSPSVDSESFVQPPIRIWMDWGTSTKHRWTFESFSILRPSRYQGRLQILLSTSWTDQCDLKQAWHHGGQLGCHQHKKVCTSSNQHHLPLLPA